MAPRNRWRMVLALLCNVFLVRSDAIPQEPDAWLRNYTEWYISKMVSQKLFTAAADPSLPIAYSPPTFYERDFEYLVEYAGDLFSEEAIAMAHDATEMVMKRPGGGVPTADEAVFRAKMLLSYAKVSQGDSSFFCRYFPHILAQLNVTYTSNTNFKDGLVYASAPVSLYGFTDSISKTGHDLFMSALHFDVLRKLGKALQTYQCNVSAGVRHKMSNIADDIQIALQGNPRNSSILWDEGAGMFRPSSGNCAKFVDVWGSALAVSVGVTTAKQTEQVLAWFNLHSHDVFQAGQVRHLPKGSHWPTKAVYFQVNGEYEQYQNGGFWATPVAWVLPVVAQANSSLASQLLQDLITDAKKHGLTEWVNHEYCGNCAGAVAWGVPGFPPYPTHGDLMGTRNYGASIASAWTAAKLLSQMTPRALPILLL